jgi:predicted nuclease of restriction endonuclease-like (RecB) superfamily
MRAFYRAWPPERICQTLSGKSLASNVLRLQSPELRAGSAARRPSREVIELAALAKAFPLPWSAYVRLLSVKNQAACRFYETEALRCGWSVRQLDRQVSSQFYERTALSKNKAAMLEKAETPKPTDAIKPEEAIRDPFVLEFLSLKDEYSESDLEDALIRHLADFLLELGDDFAFIGRQRRLRLDDAWFRIDLLFFHRRLRCLLVIDLKVGKFTHSDAGQMHLYLNYARAHWMKAGENPPVGLVLCASKGAAEAHYALDGLPNKVLAAEYQTMLPDEKLLAEELARTREALEARRLAGTNTDSGEL